MEVLHVRITASWWRITNKLKRSEGKKKISTQNYQWKCWWNCWSPAAKLKTKLFSILRDKWLKKKQPWMIETETRWNNDQWGMTMLILSKWTTSGRFNTQKGHFSIMQQKPGMHFILLLSRYLFWQSPESTRTHIVYSAQTTNKNTLASPWAFHPKPSNSQNWQHIYKDHYNANISTFQKMDLVILLFLKYFLW